MYTYKLKIKKVSGRLNESVLPSKNLVIKSNKSLSKKAILKEANTYFKKHYGLTVESLEIWDKDDLDVLYDTIYENLKSDNPEVNSLDVDSMTDMLITIIKDCLTEVNNTKNVNEHYIVKRHFLHGRGNSFRPYCEIFAVYKQKYGLNIDRANRWDFKHLHISEDLKTICHLMFYIYIDDFNKRVNECIRHDEKYGIYPSDNY